jgi:hypothetical protein
MTGADWEVDRMTTIEIIRESASEQVAVYRAIAGERQAVGVTPGEALDALERLLMTNGEEQDDRAVIIVLMNPNYPLVAERAGQL